MKPESLIFKVKFDREGQGQSSPKTIGILAKMFYTSGPNLVILAWMGEKLWCGQAQNGVNFDFRVEFGLDGYGRLTPKT